MAKKSFAGLFQNRPFVLLLLAGTLAWSITMVKSGLLYSFGLGFWGPNGHDGVWHIALANSLARGTLEMPIFAGAQIQNYHIGYDLFLAILYRVTTIPISIWYFQVLPPVTAFLTGYLAYKFVYLWRGSRAEALWAVFFVYFSGSFGWIITLLRHGEIGGESLFWSQQSLSTLINPPFAASLVLLLFGLLLLIKLQKSREAKYILLASVVFGLLIQIKAHGGVLALGGLFVLATFQYLRTREATFVKIFFGALAISLIFFLPLNNSSGGLIVLRPLWFLETMMEFPDRLGWPRYASAMVNYVLAENWPRAITAYGGAFVIFIVGNVGLRTVAGYHAFGKIKTNKKIDTIDLFLGSVIAAGVVLPMLLLQKGTPWNTIQFFYYSLFFLSILAGISVAQLLKSSPKAGKLFAGLAVLFVIPVSHATLQHYVPSRPPARVPREELAALFYIKSLPEGVILTSPFNQGTAAPPRPLPVYESTAYVSAFSGKPVFLEDQVNLDILDYPWQERRREVEQFFEEPSREFLDNNDITYIYLVGRQIDISEAREIYGKNNVFIYEFNR